MRLVGSWVALTLALAACELPRPEGAYNELEPVIPDSSVVATGRSDAGMTSAPPPVPGGVGGAQPGMQGGTAGGVAGGMAGVGGTPGGTEGGIGGTMGGIGGTGDAGVQLTPEQAALKSLEGHYLMRMDMLSTLTIKAALGVSISTSNRISHLLAAQLYVDNAGQLKAYERLCYQTFAHRCTQGCSTVTTTMDARMTDFFTKMDYTPRSYTFSNGMLTGMSNSMPLGFDGKTDARLPTVEDARVWDPVSGGKREGLLLGLTMASPLKNVNCDVYTTQIFVSKLATTKLAGSATAPSLEGPQFKLETAGSDGATLGSNQADCQDDGTGAPPVEGDQYVRFARVDVNSLGGEQGFWNCPEQGVWDTKLKSPAP